MDNALKNAYEEYRSQGFILQKSARYKKHAFREGAYADRENEAWVNSATGYVGIIPPNLIIIDNDSYEEGNEFDKLLKDLNLNYKPEPFAFTPSGGEHYAFENPNPDMVIGNHDYKAVDIYAGYQSVIPIVGTTVKNKQHVLASYRWADDIAEEFIVNKFDESMIEVLQMRPRGENGDNNYDDMGLSLAIKASEMPDDEVVNLCSLIPIETYGYDTGWLKFAMALYDRFEGSQEGLNLFQSTCERYGDNSPEYNASKWSAGHFKPTGRVTYKTLRSLSNEGKSGKIITDINTASTIEQLEELAEEMSKVRLNTTSKMDDAVRDELLDKICVKSKEIVGKPDKVKWKNAVKFIEPEKELEIPDSFDVYRLDNKYLIRFKNKIIQEVTSTMLKEQLASLGIYFGKDEMPKFKNTIQTVSSYKQIPDYTLDTSTSFNTEEQGGITVPAFIVRFNPLFELEDIDLDEHVVDDFFNAVWGGKLYDIVKLIALTIKLGERKLNRLMIVAPSNAGKSEIFTMMNFQKITMQRLVNGMRGDKGIGSDIVEGVRRSGLLLIDEANKSLEGEIKDMDKELHIDQFGKGGTQILPLHFTALTSTHSNATRNNSDELYNRFLQVELHKKDMKHTIMDSELFLKDTGKYTSTIRGKLLQIFKETLFNDEGKEELKLLQEKYRLPINNDLDELLYEIGEDFINETKASAIDHGDIIFKNGEYFCKRKTDVTKYFENRLGEIESIDVGKYSELLTKHFVSEDRKSVKIGGKTSKYYDLSLLPYTEDEETLVLSEFDDLDLDEF